MFSGEGKGAHPHRDGVVGEEHTQQGQPDLSLQHHLDASVEETDGNREVAAEGRTVLGHVVEGPGLRLRLVEDHLTGVTKHPGVDGGRSGIGRRVGNPGEGLALGENPPGVDGETTEPEQHHDQTQTPDRDRTPLTIHWADPGSRRPVPNATRSSPSRHRPGPRVAPPTPGSPW